MPGDEDGKLKRVGILEREKPTLLLFKTLEYDFPADADPSQSDIPRRNGRKLVGHVIREEKYMRGGPATAAPRQKRGKPWRDENPGEERLPIGSETTADERERTTEGTQIPEDDRAVRVEPFSWRGEHPEDKYPKRNGDRTELQRNVGNPEFREENVMRDREVERRPGPSVGETSEG